jgi:hypothetical protein
VGCYAGFRYFGFYYTECHDTLIVTSLCYGCNQFIAQASALAA